MLELNFTSESDTFSDALREYRDIWNERGAEIVSSLEAASHLSFSTSVIGAKVYEGPSYSGDENTPMKLRASYSQNTKLATLTHELGHVLLSDNEIAPEEDQDIHDILFLFLFDAWVQLEGEEFAKKQVEIEKKRGERYVESWNRCLSLAKKERKNNFQEMLSK